MYDGVFFVLGDARCVQVGCILWIPVIFGIILKHSTGTDHVHTFRCIFFPINTGSLWQLKILALFYFESFTESMIIWDILITITHNKDNCTLGRSSKESNKKVLGKIHPEMFAGNIVLKGILFKRYLHQNHSDKITIFLPSTTFCNSSSIYKASFFLSTAAACGARKGHCKIILLYLKRLEQLYLWGSIIASRHTCLHNPSDMSNQWNAGNEECVDPAKPRYTMN